MAVRTNHLVGRNSDLRLLRTAHDSASGALVIGPAGVGKTYLLRSFLDDISARGGRVERFVASPTTQHVLLGALSPVLAQASIVDASSVEQLTRAICSILVDSEGSSPPALLFDDVNLLDTASADVVYQLVSTGQASAWMTIRSGEPIPHPIESLWRSGDILRIDLTPINRDDTTHMAEELLSGVLEPSAADAIWDLTLGIPLYVREALNDAVASGVLRRNEHGWEISGPLEPGQRVQDLLVRRLERLSNADRELVEMVALAEPVATGLLGHSEQDAAVDLVRRGLLQWCNLKTKDALVSGHPLLASCANATVSPAQAQELLNSLARRAASATTVPYGTNLGLVVAARSVGADVQATTLVAAAREALATFDLTNALDIARSAVATDARSSEAQHVLGEILQMNGDPDGADQHLSIALQLADDDVMIVRIANKLSNLLAYSRSDPRAAISVLQRAAERLKSPMAHLTISVETAVVAGLLGCFPEVLETGYKILDVIDLDDDTRSITLGNVCYAQAMLIELDRFDTDWAEAIELASVERLANRPAEFDLLWALKGAVSMGRGKFHDGLGELEQHLAVCRSENQYRGVAELIRAHMLIAKGDGAALDAVNNSLDQLTAMDPFNTTVLSRATGGLVAALAGDHQAAAQYLDGLRADEVADDPRATAWLGRALAAQAAAAGNLEDAASLAASAGIETVKRSFLAWGALAMHDAVRYQRPDLVADELMNCVGNCGSPFMELLARHAQAAAANEVADLRSVAHEFFSMGADLHAGETWLDVAANEEDKSQRKIAVVTAQLIAADLALDQWFVWSDVDPVLSPRECDVTNAAVSGASSKEIAEQLFVSVRTVDNHLGRIYRGLGLAGRAELIETFRMPRSP